MVHLTLEKLVKVCDKMSSWERFVIFLAELAGTSTFVLLGCLGCVSGSPEIITFGFGFAIMICVQVFGHISGAHVNPAVTVAAAIFGNISLINVPIYIVAQIFGAICGFELLKILVKNHENDVPNLCSPNPNPNLNSVQIFLSEFLLTLVLIWVCCGIWDLRNKNRSDSIPLRLGLAVTGLAMAGITLSGAHMNPARSFGPALLNNGTWDYQWAYWAGPLFAGVIGPLIYKIVFLQIKEDAKGCSEDNP
uniref:Aquaporin-like n=1 Tax=Diabrotica virgifera virgifera TaxID=50390 RepID=A0A6P7H174_DIAVI